MTSGCPAAVGGSKLFTLAREEPTRLPPASYRLTCKRGSRKEALCVDGKRSAWLNGWLNYVRRLVEKTTGAMPYLSFFAPAGSGSNERK
jgi:hypothetical protein